MSPAKIPNPRLILLQPVPHNQFADYTSLGFNKYCAGNPHGGVAVMWMKTGVTQDTQEEISFFNGGPILSTWSFQLAHLRYPEPLSLDYRVFEPLFIL